MRLFATKSWFTSIRNRKNHHHPHIRSSVTRNEVNNCNLPDCWWVKLCRSKNFSSAFLIRVAGRRDNLAKCRLVALKSSWVTWNSNDFLGLQKQPSERERRLRGLNSIYSGVKRAEESLSIRESFLSLQCQWPGTFRWYSSEPADFAFLYFRLQVVQLCSQKHAAPVFLFLSYSRLALVEIVVDSLSRSDSPNSLFFCLFTAFVEGFEIGREQIFSIINDVTLYDLKTAEQPIGYRISGAVRVGAIWGNNDNGFLLSFEVWTSQ